MSDQNGRNASIWKEIGETKERAAAWVFRVLIALVSLMISAVGFLSWNALDRVASTVDENGKLMWTSIDKLSSEIRKIGEDTQATKRDVSIISQTVTDHVREDAANFKRLSEEEADHERRMRDLERPPVRP